jgi:hypothetical protein
MKNSAFLQQPLTGPAELQSIVAVNNTLSNLLRFAGKHPQKWVIRANGARHGARRSVVAAPEVTNKWLAA